MLRTAHFPPAEFPYDVRFQQKSYLKAKRHSDPPPAAAPCPCSTARTTPAASKSVAVCVGVLQPPRISHAFLVDLVPGSLSLSIFRLSRVPVYGFGASKYMCSRRKEVGTISIKCKEAARSTPSNYPSGCHFDRSKFFSLAQI